MDVVDDADGSLDPRIQIELENLNNATDDINKLESELDEAHTAFRQLLSDTTRRLKEISEKLGNACIEKARCYYEALEVARLAQVECQQQAQLFQRASEIHAAAKETVALAETRFVSHQHEWNFDQAWQDVLNHATIKVMDAENQKAECGREHRRKAMLFHDAETRMLQLEEKHRRAIIKARPYFDMKAQCDQMLATQKERVECLQSVIKEAKKNYASSLRALEEISNRIHQQRRDSDFLANGPREPGVGAELVSPGKCPNYDLELQHFRINQANLTPNNQFGKQCSALQSSEGKVCDSEDDGENLGKRSVDGSETTSAQWELELQASIENLNDMSIENATYDGDCDLLAAPGLRVYHQNSIKSNAARALSPSFLHIEESVIHKAKYLGRSLSKDIRTSMHPATGGTTSSTLQQVPLGNNDLVDLKVWQEHKVTSRGDTSVCSKGISVNRTAADFEASRSAEAPEERSVAEYVPNGISKIEISEKERESHVDINSTWNQNKDVVADSRTRDNSSVRDIADVKTDKPITNPFYAENSCRMDESLRNDCTSPRQKMIGAQNDSEKARKSFSVTSTPVRLPSSSTLPATSSLANETTGNLNRYSILNRLSGKSTSIKELPLLSFFKVTNDLAESKGRSCSMIALDDRKSLILDNSHLNNIQAVSAEKLASTRHKLIGNVP